VKGSISGDLGRYNIHLGGGDHLGPEVGLKSLTSEGETRKVHRGAPTEGISAGTKFQAKKESELGGPFPEHSGT